MAGRKLHALDLGDVPGGNNKPARVGVATDLVDDPGDLIVCPPVRSLPAAPLLSINGTQIAVRIGPFVPDGDAVRLEVGDIGVSAQEPDEFAHNRLEMKPLRRNERKAKGQIESKLPAEQRADARASAVLFYGAVVERLAHEIEIGLHGPAVLTPNRP
jgi:hypothetical protein